MKFTQKCDDIMLCDAIIRCYLCDATTTSVVKPFTTLSGKILVCTKRFTFVLGCSPRDSLSPHSRGSGGAGFLYVPPLLVRTGNEVLATSLTLIWLEEVVWLRHPTHHPVPAGWVGMLGARA